MTFQLRPTAADYHEAYRYNQRRLLQRSRNRWSTAGFFLLALAAWGAIGYNLSILAEQGTGIGWRLFLLFLAVLALALLEQLSRGRAALRWAAAQSAHASTLTVADDGLRFDSAHGHTILDWQALQGNEYCGAHLLIYVNGASFILVPSSAFADLAERDTLSAWIRSHADHAATRALAKAEGEAVVGGDVPNGGAQQNLMANLTFGLRSAAFLRPANGTVRVSWSQFVVLALIGVAIPVAADMARIGLRGSFAWYALPATLYSLPVMVLAAWAIALFAGQAQRTLALLTAIAALAIPIGILELLARVAANGDWLRLPRNWGFAAYYLAPLWLAAAAAVAAIRILGVAKPRWAGTFAIAVLLIALPLTTGSHGSSLWVKPYDETADNTYNRRFSSPAGEDTFYLQPRLLEQQLAGLQPGRKGIIDLYFVGMAGYSRQDVFMKEVQSVSTMFKERFDTAGRSAMLINNPKTAAELPIANGTSLKLVLKRIGEVMDRDEDILFLFLTSHGSRDHRFSLDFWPMRFNDLDPGRLREILDESGIKRRVIVVSACYSGGFIEALKNENSLVIAASAPDKNSFGCDNEAEYTYFGKAYFDEALRQTHSFVEAFDLAKPRIAERERKADHDPSDPRIHVGANIEAPLAALADDRKARPLRDDPETRTPQNDTLAIYFDVIGLDRRVRQARQECLREMNHIAPLTQIADQPDAYGGITPGSRFWPQIVSSWLEYAESWCNAANDESAYRKAVRRAWLAHQGEKEVQSALAFYRTPTGKRFLDAEEEVMQVAHTGLSDARARTTQPAVRKLQSEQARIVRLHQKELEAAAAKRP